jgi:hypothetical protein
VESSLSLVSFLINFNALRGGRSHHGQEDSEILVGVGEFLGLSVWAFWAVTRRRENLSGLSFRKNHTKQINIL